MRESQIQLKKFIYIYVSFLSVTPQKNHGPLFFFLETPLKKMISLQNDVTEIL